jgi:hypothetical protein
MLNTRQVRLGDSATLSQNFIISTPAVPDGTMSIARENGTHVLDILASGAVNFPELSKVISGGATSPGHLVLPGGLIVNWGSAVISTTAANTWASTNVTLSKAWPTSMLGAVVTSRNATGSGQTSSWNAIENGLTQLTVSLLTSAGALSNISSYYIAWGY